jgi:hypothetical protein
MAPDPGENSVFVPSRYYYFTSLESGSRGGTGVRTTENGISRRPGSGLPQGRGGKFPLTEKGLPLYCITREDGYPIWGLIGKPVQGRHGPAAVTGDETCSSHSFLQGKGKAQEVGRSGSQKTCPSVWPASPEKGQKAGPGFLPPGPPGIKKAGRHPRVFTDPGFFFRLAAGGWGASPKKFRRVADERRFDRLPGEQFFSA